MRKLLAFAAHSVALVAASTGYAQLLSDDFDTDSSASYNVLLFGSADEVMFDYDYGTIGIPEAPNSMGSTTTGVRMAANITGNSTSAVQIAPLGFAPTLAGQDYSLTYDLWMNFNGPAPGGGSGSTEAMMVGVGFDDSAAIEIGNTNGTYFTVTGDGGSSTDIRSFTNDGFNGAGINQGPSNNTNNAYYAGIFPGGIDVGALPIQGGQDNQTGTTVAGQAAFEWHQVRVDVIGSQVDFYIDGLLIASDRDADITGNVMIGYGDYFSGSSDNAAWSFAVIDNLSVTAIPEPSSLVLLSLGGLALMRRRS